MTIEGDIYIRYQCFRDQNEFAAAIKKRCPHKIDIGAVFSAPPSQHTTLKPEAFHPVERELVFDIDMTDYDGIRTCCSGANICLRCWPYMTMALKVVDTALREDFAFKDILWIYSGRRGIHCWVCDPGARALQNDARDALVNYMNIELGDDNLKDGEKNDNRILRTFKTPMHASLRRAYDILEPFFERYICPAEGQGLLASKPSYRKVLNTIPDTHQHIRVDLDKLWGKNSGTSGSERFRDLKAACLGGQAGDSKKRKLDTDLQAWLNELILRHTYPRLDINVSKHQNHLLKSPFCVHPKTGRVCVPIDPSQAEKFDPFSVPTVRTLCDQIDAYDKSREKSGASGEVATDIDKTDMKTYIKTFEDTFLQSMKASMRKIMRDKADKTAAIKVDF